MAPLTDNCIRQYEREGYIAPIPVLDDSEVRHSRSYFDEFFRSTRDVVESLSPSERGRHFTGTHEQLLWVFELATRPRVLDAVESVLGQDILLWGSQWFPKQPHDPSFVSWHQDGTYWGLHPANVCTAWIALTASTEENGCLLVSPGTHHRGQLPHRNTFAPENALTRGQEIAVEVDEASAVSLILEPGDMSIHHIGVAHASRANLSGRPRIGLAVRFISPDVVRDEGANDRAILVRGTDLYGHFELVDRPG